VAATLARGMAGCRTAGSRDCGAVAKGVRRADTSAPMAVERRSVAGTGVPVMAESRNVAGTGAPAAAESGIVAGTGAPVAAEGRILAGTGAPAATESRIVAGTLVPLGAVREPRTTREVGPGARVDRRPSGRFSLWAGMCVDV
jgi:hypothetical protein